MIETLPGISAYLEAGGLAGEWRRALGLDVRAAVAFSPLSVDLLTPGELARYRNLDGTERRRSWLTGRAALRRLLRRLDRGPDTAGLAFPAPDMSLTHSGGMAVAVACLDAPGQGLGVDLEAERSLRSESARFFLSDGERARLALRGLAPESAGFEDALLRLWTAKEALFKADTGNRGRILADYRLSDPMARRGRAALRAELGRREFRYVSHRLAGWHLSLAAGTGRTLG
ncbi:MAG: 4'-phosphopantetheinyl transferase superfamily protein [Fibrobacteres bacterium]|nr:4'-phosphopantetheinyl transferase superfamily protein [Fibrobacterota bacterium]